MQSSRLVHNAHAIPQLGSSIQMAGKHADIWKGKGGDVDCGNSCRLLDRGRYFRFGRSYYKVLGPGTYM